MGRAERIIFEPAHLYLGGREIASSFYGWDERAERRTPQVTLLVLDRKILYWLIKIMFLQKVEAAIKSGIKCTFCMMGF